MSDFFCSFVPPARPQAPAGGGVSAVSAPLSYLWDPLSTVKIFIEKTTINPVRYMIPLRFLEYVDYVENGFDFQRVRYQKKISEEFDPLEFEVLKKYLKAGNSIPKLRKPPLPGFPLLKRDQQREKSTVEGDEYFDASPDDDYTSLIKALVLQRYQPIVGLKFEFIDIPPDKQVFDTLSREEQFKRVKAYEDWLENVVRQTAHIIIRIDTDASQFEAYSAPGKLSLPLIKAKGFSMYLSHVSVNVFLHEFGHAMGMLHEHQNPNKPIQWNKDAVYCAYRHVSKEDVDRNILTPEAMNWSNGTEFDPKSIMLYNTPKKLGLAADSDNPTCEGLTSDTEVYSNEDLDFTESNYKLSKNDIHWLSQMYPLNGKRDLSQFRSLPTEVALLKGPQLFVLFLMLWSFYRYALRRPEVDLAWVVYALLLGATFSYLYAYKQLEERNLQYKAQMLMLVLLLITMKLFYAVDRPSAYLLLPYLLWLSSMFVYASLFDLSVTPPES